MLYHNYNLQNIKLYHVILLHLFFLDGINSFNTFLPKNIRIHALLDQST